MTWLTTILFFLSTFGNARTVQEHPIYTSLTEVDYKENRKILEISTKIFVDDLEKYFEKREGKKIEIGTDREHPEANQLLKEYLKKHLKFYADGKALDYTILGKEMGEKSNLFAMYIFLEIKDVSAFSKLEVENDILIHHLYNQLNFVACHTKRGLVKKIARKGNTKISFTW